MKTTRHKHLSVIIPKEPAKIDVPPELPPLPMAMAAYGCRGSGKSTAIASMLRRYQEANCCHRIFLICPTYQSNRFLWEDIVDLEDVYEEANQAALDDVIRKTEAEADSWRVYKENRELFDQYKKQRDELFGGTRDEIDEELLLRAYEAGIAELEEYPDYKYPGCKHPCIFVVIDDAMSSSIFNPSTKTKNNLSNLVIKHRHIGTREHGGLSIIIALQSYKSQSGVLSKAIRSNCTLMSIWGIRSDKMLSDIYEEMAREIPEETFIAAYDHCVQERHDCFTVEFSPLRVRRNFDEILDLGVLGETQKTKSVEIEHVDNEGEP